MFYFINSLIPLSLSFALSFPRSLAPFLPPLLFPFSLLCSSLSPSFAFPFLPPLLFPFSLLWFSLFPFFAPLLPPFSLPCPLSPSFAPSLGTSLSPFRYLPCLAHVNTSPPSVMLPQTLVSLINNIFLPCFD